MTCRAEVDYVIDGMMAHDVIEGETMTAKVYPDGRGHVKVPGASHIYRQVERMIVRRPV